MRRARTWALLASALFFFCASLAPAQSSAPANTPGGVLIDMAPKPSARFPARWYPPPSQQVYAIAVQRGHPYIADLVTTSRIADAGSASAKAVSTTVQQMRDAQGRRREEIEMPRPDRQGRTMQARQVTVHDPVSHCDFQWIEPWVVAVAAPTQPVATVTCTPLVLRYTNQNVWRDGATPTQQIVRDRFSETISEPLGHRLVAGLDAIGTRRTTVRLDGQGAPLRTVVTESWYSPELDELLSMRMNDPAGAALPGLPSFELTHIRREDPKTSLFYPPAEYRIDSTIPVTR